MTGGVVSPVLDPDMSLSSNMCGGVVAEEGGEWEPES